MHRSKYKQACDLRQPGRDYRHDATIRFFRDGGAPDRPCHRRRAHARGRPIHPVSARAKGRRGGRLSRHQGPRSVSRARGSRRAGDALLDRGGEPPDGGVSGRDPRARADQGAVAPAVGLSQVRRAVSQAGRYFYFKNDGLQNQSVLYTQAALTAEPTTLLDPNLLSADGTVALSTLAVSDDGRLVAYGTSASGSDWEEFRVRDVATGRDRPDHLRWIKFSGASWTKDGAGFLYSRYPQPGDKALSDVNRFQKVYYHRLGTDQTQDVLVYERPDQPDWGMNAEVTDDGRYAVLHVWLGTDRRNRVATVVGDLGVHAP